MPDSVNSERRLLEDLLETLRNLPEAEAEMSGKARRSIANQGHGAEVELRVGGKTANLMIKVKRTLYPRDVRQEVWTVGDLHAGLPRSISFVAAQSISPGAKDLLREEGIGYYDSGGSLFLCASDIYVYVDKPPPKSMSKSIRSLYSGRRAQVLQAVLMRNGEWFGVKDIAEEAMVSPATVSQVLAELELFDWVLSSGQGPRKRRRLHEPGVLLDTWVKQLPAMKPPAMRRYFVPLIHVEGLAEKFAEVCAEKKAEYAITHEAAGQQYAPFLSSISQVHCRMLSGPAVDEVISALDAHLVDRGANLAIVEVNSRRELLFRQFVNQIWLASPVQVYLDLMRTEGRARELAAHLRNEMLGF